MTRAPQPTARAGVAHAPVAVVDIGSNSGRVVVLRRTPSGHVDVVDDERAPLRLVRAIDQGGALGEAAIGHTLQVMRDFRAVATRCGAARVIAVATAAVREASDGGLLIERIRAATGFEVRVLSAEEEGAFALRGAIQGLPVTEGLLIDIGGGSMQAVAFQARAISRTWTTGLGALRLSARFLTTDPPDRTERRRLEDHVLQALKKAGVAPLAPGAHLVGTGGTVRNLAKIHRRTQKYPVGRLHGYTISRGALQQVADLVVGRAATARRAVPGLNPDRVDSIAGGALVALTTMQYLGARELLVSGQGLRDGVAMQPLGVTATSPREARAAAVAALGRRFTTWDPAVAARRQAIATRLQQVITPDLPPADTELLGYAAAILDIGRCVDYYNRHEHTAAIVIATDLDGFSHRALAMLAAMIARAGDRDSGLKGLRSLLSAPDEVVVNQCGALLDLADQLERRWDPASPAGIEVRRTVEGVTVAAPLLDAWRPAQVAAAYQDRLGVLAVSSSLPDR